MPFVNPQHFCPLGHSSNNERAWKNASKCKDTSNAEFLSRPQNAMQERSRLPEIEADSLSLRSYYGHEASTGTHCEHLPFAAVPQHFCPLGHSGGSEGVWMSG
jgi:hypothetical protein